MAEIKSFDNPGEKELGVNPIGGIFSLLKPLDKFTKSALLLFVLILISLPFFLSNYFDTRQKATTPWNFITKQGSKLYDGTTPFRFAGSNMHWLGLIDIGKYPTHFHIENGIETAVEMGANVVRGLTLGVSVGNPNSVEPSLNNFNNAAFESIDYAIKTAGDNKIRLIIPLTDNWQYYHGGKYTFTGWRGLASEDQFFSNPEVVQDFKAYISQILNHVNQYTGVALKDDPTILAWEIGSELNNKTSAWDDNWTENIASYIKSVDNNHLVSDGRMAESKALRHITASQLQLPSVDIYSGHFYPMDSLFAKQDADLAASYNKAYYIGEYDSTNQDSIGGLGTISQTTLTKIDGLASAKVNISQANPTSSWYVQLGQGNLAFESGKTYTISFSAKGDSERNISVMLQKSTVYFSQTISLTTTWKSYSFSYTPTTTQTGINLRFNLAQATGNVWLDKIFYGTSNVNALQNSSFETSETSPVFPSWTFSTRNNYEFLDQFLPAIESMTNVSGTLFWELWPHSNSHGYSGIGKYDQHYPGDDLAMQERMKLMRSHAYNMRSLPIPPSKITNPPLLHPIISVSTGKQIDWRGVTAANTYNIERSQDGSDWQVISTGLTAYQAPFTDTTVSSTSIYYYRVQGVNLDGVTGAYSNIEPPLSLSPTPTPGATTITLNPTADTYVDSAKPSNSFGADSVLLVDSNPSFYISYLKFDLGFLANSTITDAKLRLFVTDPSTSTQNIKTVLDSFWTENITYNTKPSLGTILTSFSATSSNNWKEIDLTSYIKSKAGQIVSIGIDQAAGGDGLDFISREALNNKPQFIIQAEGFSAPPPDSTPTPTPTPTPTAVPITAPILTPTPTQAVNQAMTVSEINMSYTKSGSNNNIKTLIRIINQTTNSSLESAIVSLRITTPSGKGYSYQATTGANGEVSFSHKSKEKGTFTATVTNVQRQVYTYNPTITTKTLLVN